MMFPAKSNQLIPHFKYVASQVQLSDSNKMIRQVLQIPRTGSFGMKEKEKDIATSKPKGEMSYLPVNRWSCVMETMILKYLK
jgi:hypothetical protein